MTLKSLLPDVDSLLSLEPEELAGYLLEYLNSLPEGAQINRGNYTDPVTLGYPPERKDVAQAVMEAWIWLEREGLIAPRPGPQMSPDWIFITRRGRTLTNHMDVEAFLKSNLLPRQLIHPLILTKASASFLRGEYDSAVFLAMKEVEVAVRIAAGYPTSSFGVDMMRAAFHPQTGPLTDQSRLRGEKQADSDVFAGAIGRYKNPSSHRVAVTDPAEAVEIIVLASHLLKIVEARAEALGEQRP